jgi:hypothetical protein
MSTLTSTLNIIKDELRGGSQSWTREVTVRAPRSAHKVRATVKRDFYAFQSRIYVEVWNEANLAWNRVQTLDGSDYGDLPTTGAPDAYKIKGSDQVIDNLLTYAIEIIEG